MKVAIVKYNAGNIFSVINAVRRLGIEPLWTDDAEELLSADRVIFPGQGEAHNAMEYLKAHNLDNVIRDLTQPVLGICIGQQLLCRHSEEGNTDCLGIFPLDVKRFQPTRHEDKIPQMGWNKLEELKTPLFEGIQETGNQGIQETRNIGIQEDPYVYFVHSYYVPCDERYTIAKTNFTLDYSAAIHKDNFYATQFHPEKSGAVGSRIIENFIKIQ